MPFYADISHGDIDHKFERIIDDITQIQAQIQRMSKDSPVNQAQFLLDKAIEELVDLKIDLTPQVEADGFVTPKEYLTTSSPSR